jgi:hypothetical protein
MSKSIATICTLAILAAGCSDSAVVRSTDEVAQANLTDAGELYRHYQFTKKKPPQKFADLSTLRGLGGNGYEWIRTGKIVLLYGATLPDLDEEPGKVESNEVLAYESQVPESGGYVLMLNRTIKKMTADEFKAAPKPSGATTGSSTAKKK